MDSMSIAVVGGTGALGTGLADRFARAGHHVIIGSRDHAKAAAAAAALASIDGCTAQGMGNVEAARAADIIVLTVPFSSQRDLLTAILPAIERKILIDATVGLKPPKVGIVQLPPEGSAGLAAAQIVGDRARLVSAFQNVSASELAGDAPLSGDILVTGDDREACDVAIALCHSIGARAFYSGPLANSAATEALTSVLITLNRQFKVHASIRITELP